MTITATTLHDQQRTEQPTLVLAFELGVNTWKLACTTGAAQRPRERRVPARDIAAVQEEIARAKPRFGVPEAARVVRCYEAGRDGFWLHRALVAQGVANIVVESSSLWEGSPVPPGLRQRLVREWEQLAGLSHQLGQLEADRQERLRSAEDPAMAQVRQLLTLKGRGVNSAWGFVMECFGWRVFRSGKEVGALSGLPPPPHARGTIAYELGIAKAGKRYLRALASAIAWGWRRFQPESALAPWSQARFGRGRSRLRRIGIVALARKWLIALWRFLERGALPAGAALKATVRI